LNFEFATATRIVFGAGRMREAGALARSFGRRALLVTGRTTDRIKPLIDVLDSFTSFPVTGEPTVGAVRDGVRWAQDEGCDLVVSCGGGSAIDAGKAIAALLTNPGDPLDYLEVIGKGKPITKPPVPFMAIPTTAGTGAEVTRNAVLGSPEHKGKVSMRSPFMLPRVALVDPDIVHASAASRLDALTQLIEPFVSHRANPMTDAICREGMRRWREGGNENWALAALFSGLALTNAGLGAVHGFAGPLGGMLDAPHGALCAALLPAVMEMNYRLAPNRERFQEIHRLVGDVGALVRELQVPPLKTYGLRREDFPAVVEKAAVASSMQGNPVVLTRPELLEILERAWAGD
jgi:alcohol dehydrogenase class IV